MNEFVRDVLYGFRMLRKSRMTTGISILALALGIGANAAVFSVLNALLIRPLPFADAERLVQIEQNDRGRLIPAIAPSKFIAWRRAQASFEQMAAYDIRGRGYSLASAGRPELVTGYRVSGEFFSMLGVPPQSGRAISPEDDRPGAQPVTVLGHGIWRSRFGGDPSVVGRQVLLEGESHTVIGIMPAGFGYPSEAQIWTALRLDPATEERARYLLVTARLRPGATPAAVQGELEPINREWLVAQGWDDSEERVSVRPLQVYLHGDSRPVLLVMLAAVALVLLIAGANVVNLQLARSAARQKEVAIRVALGAGPARILRQWLVESALLGVLGGLAGLVLCAAVVRLLLASAPLTVPLQWSDVVLDGNVLAFTLGLALLTGLITGLAPALQARRAAVHEGLKEGSPGGGVSGGRRARALRYTLVVVEVGLALVLGIAAGLLIKSFAGMVGTDPGLEPENVVTLKLPLPDGKYNQPGALERLQRQLLPEIAALPDVRQAALVNSLPMEPGGQMTFVIEGSYAPGSHQGTGVGAYRSVSPGYFDALEIPLLRGRLFTDADSAGAPGALILNEAAVRRYFPRGDALGQRITIGPPDMPDAADPAPREVVGIVKDVRENGLEREAPAILYVPIPQVPASLAELLTQAPMNLILRTEGEAAGLMRPVQDRIGRFDRDLPVTAAQPLAEIFSRSVGPQRFRTLLFGGFAGLALLLTTVGVFGVLTHLVGQRTREIGIRLAFGGHPGDIVRLVLRQALTPVLIGAVLGLLGSRFAMRLIAGFLFGVESTDLAIFANVAGVVIGAALIATYIPARRASRIDPLEALRHE